MRLAQPEALWLLLLLPVYLVWRWRQAAHQGLPYSALSLLQGVGKTRPWSHWLIAGFNLLGVLLLIGALSRPQMGREMVKTTQKGIDIMLAVDTSASMLAEDFKPNRLEAAKKVLENFIVKQQGNRLGMVVFAGRSFTLIPLTSDYGMVTESVKEIHPEMVREAGTAIGDALTNALYRFREDSPTSRVIVLLTDGENTAGDTQPLVAAQMARQKNIRVHVIGIGTPEGVPVPVIDPRSGRKVYLREPNGELYLSRINEEDLRKMASMTGGLYFRADSENTLNAIYNQINEMEKTEFETSKRTVYAERMQWLLLPGLLLLVIAGILRALKGQILEARS
ncbi:MAG: VWA domain-containing protein [Candidatus Sericytochromatia bacterium]